MRDRGLEYYWWTTFDVSVTEFKENSAVDEICKLEGKDWP